MPEDKYIQEVRKTFKMSRRLLTTAMVLNAGAIVMCIDVLNECKNTKLSTILCIGLIVLIVNLYQLRLRYKEANGGERKILENNGYKK